MRSRAQTSRRPRDLLADLHVHLHGAVGPADLLRYLAGQDRVRWDWYEGHFAAAYGRRPDARRLVERFRAGDDGAVTPFAREATWTDADGGSFARFSAKAKLRFAARPGDGGEVPLAAIEDEAVRFARGVRRDLIDQGVGYCELRSFASPRLAEYLATVDGPTMRLAVSLPRADPWAEWDRVRALALGPYGEVVTGIDFCNAEEGFPPKDQARFLAEVAAFNACHPHRALAVLYHVGETFADKSIESAIRWVQEAATAGAHRLGHATALGVDPRVYGHHRRTETAGERLDQIDYDLAHADELDDAGVGVDTDALRAEKDRLAAQPGTVVTLAYDDARLAEVRRRQGVALGHVRESGAVVEVCPTSNRRLLGLDSPGAHPVHRFLAEDLAVVVATDDPGVFGVTLAGELDWVVTHTGGGDGLRRQLVAAAWANRSEILTSRP